MVLTAVILIAILTLGFFLLVIVMGNLIYTKVDTTRDLLVIHNITTTTDNNNNNNSVYADDGPTPNPRTVIPV